MANTREIVHAFLVASAMAVALMLSGCDNKETILDVDTPGGGVEIERSTDSGAITVDVNE